MYLSVETDGGSYEHGNEFSGSVQDREFLDLWQYYQLLKKDSVTRRWLVSLFSENQARFQVLATASMKITVFEMLRRVVW
jgi:hypothetical protein